MPTSTGLEIEFPVNATSPPETVIPRPPASSTMFPFTVAPVESPREMPWLVDPVTLLPEISSLVVPLSPTPMPQLSRMLSEMATFWDPPDVLTPAMGASVITHPRTEADETPISLTPQLPGDAISFSDATRPAPFSAQMPKALGETILQPTTVASPPETVTPRSPASSTMFSPTTSEYEFLAFMPCCVDSATEFSESVTPPELTTSKPSLQPTTPLARNDDPAAAKR